MAIGRGQDGSEDRGAISGKANHPRRLHLYVGRMGHLQEFRESLTRACSGPDVLSAKMENECTDSFLRLPPASVAPEKTASWSSGIQSQPAGCDLSQSSRLYDNHGSQNAALSCLSSIIGQGKIGQLRIASASPCYIPSAAELAGMPTAYQD